MQAGSIAALIFFLGAFDKPSFNPPDVSKVPPQFRSSLLKPRVRPWEDYRAVVRSRSLFAPVAPEPEARSVPSAFSSLRLLGILISSQNAVVLEENGRVLFLKEGEAREGVCVLEVTRGRVRVRSGDDERIFSPGGV